MSTKIEWAEVIAPPPGVCWNPSRLLDMNCHGCRYLFGCTCKRKGNEHGSKRKKQKIGR